MIQSSQLSLSNLTGARRTFLSVTYWHHWGQDLQYNRSGVDKSGPRRDQLKGSYRFSHCPLTEDSRQEA